MGVHETTEHPFPPSKPWWNRKFNHTRFYYHQYCMIMQAFIKESIEMDKSNNYNPSTSYTSYSIEHLKDTLFYIDEDGYLRVLTNIIVSDESTRLNIAIDNPYEGTLKSAYEIIQNDSTKKHVDLEGKTVCLIEILLAITKYCYNIKESTRQFDRTADVVIEKGKTTGLVSLENFCPNQLVVTLLMIETLCNAFTYMIPQRLLDPSVYEHIDTSLKDKIPEPVLHEYTMKLEQIIEPATYMLNDFLGRLNSVVRIDTTENIILESIYGIKIWLYDKDNDFRYDNIHDIKFVIPILYAYGQHIYIN